MAKKIKISEERTCVECGCTDSRACAGGCYWITTHPATPTGICSCCHPQPAVQIGFVRLARVSKTKFWLTNDGHEALETTEAKLAAVVERFFNVNF